MGLQVLPAVGAQARRKSDGVLGEVYATDPPHNLLSVRWPTVPGAYAHEDVTADQFARAWELTGWYLEPPHETKVAMALIAVLVLLLFVVVIVHDARLTAYVPYEAVHPVNAPSQSILDNAQALHERYGLQAAESCASGADEYIRSITEHRFHWNDADALEPRFDRFESKVAAPGVLTMISNKAAVSNGFGVFKPLTIYCNYDVSSNEVLAYATEER